MLISCMEQMPHDMATLAGVFHSGKILNFGIDSFMVYGQDHKFEQLMEFVLRASKP